VLVQLCIFLGVSVGGIGFIAYLSKKLSQPEPPKKLSRPELLEQPKISRNAPCPCGSGKKFKFCCAGDPFRIVDSTHGYVDPNLNNEEEPLQQPKTSEPLEQVKTSRNDACACGSDLRFKDDASNNNGLFRIVDNTHGYVESALTTREELLHRANALAHDGDYSSAANLYSEFLKLGSDRIAQTNRGLCCLRLDKPKQAISDFQSVIASGPSSGESTITPLYLLGYALMEAGQFDDAISQFDRALRTDSSLVADSQRWFCVLPPSP
jgi:SEC-C motif/Tetratricopeptide repeat